MPVCVTTPRTCSPSTTRSATSCWNSVRFGWFSSIERIACLYRTRSACARVARTADLAGVQDAELDAGAIGRLRHRAAKRVDP